MGLDMYLQATLYTGNHTRKDMNDKIRKQFPVMFKSGNLNSITLKFETGYWRKANHIHKWFVDNVQDGEDECETHDVDREDLQKLKELCLEVLKDKTKAGNILPTQDGFFFGGEEIEEWYFSDIEETIKIIDRCLELPEEWEFEYRSSW